MSAKANLSTSPLSQASKKEVSNPKGKKPLAEVKPKASTDTLKSKSLQNGAQGRMRGQLSAHSLSPFKPAEFHNKSNALFKTKAYRAQKPALSSIKVLIDVGFGNKLFLRGSGANLSWDVGIPLKNIGPNEWIWETRLSFSDCQFKLSINDCHYEEGPNRQLHHGDEIIYTPTFK